MVRLWTIALLLAAYCSGFGDAHRPSRGFHNCTSFANVAGESIPCYCEPRTRGRLTTNGLCRRHGSSTLGCTGGTIDVAGLCVGNNAIQRTTRFYCLSEMKFSTGTCVPNEMLHEGTALPTGPGSYQATLNCGSQLEDANGCANPFNVSIRAGLRGYQLVYINGLDNAVFIGSYATGATDNRLQNTYNSVMSIFCPSGLTSGWLKSGAPLVMPSCMPNGWRVNTDCGVRSILIEGSGGKQCLGHEDWTIPEPQNWGISSMNDEAWKIWKGIIPEVPGPTESDWLKLPRVVIVPGNWIPEKS